MVVEVEIWTYRSGAWSARQPPNTEIAGWNVEAIDGSIGEVDEATDDVGRSYIVVDTGSWIFGKRVLLPAGVVDRVDSEAETIYVHRTKDEIKNAPEFEESAYREPAYREGLGAYYGPGGAGWRDPRAPRAPQPGGAPGVPAND